MRAEHAVELGREQHLSRHSQATAEAPSSGPCLEDTPPREPLSAVRARLLSCLRSRLPHHPHPPDWASLLQQTEDFADIEIRYGYYWRDGYGGVLPSGYDASSVAAEAVAELLTEQQLNGLVLEPHLFRRDLKKRARKIINRLHHRMENKIMRNTDDLIPFLTDDGETISVVEKVPAPDRTSRTSLEILLEKEDAIRFEEFKAEIRAVLAQERLLLRLFDCFCADICKPKHQARKLKLPVRQIQDLQRRLRRKLAAQGYVPPSWRSRI